MVAPPPEIYILNENVIGLLSCSVMEPILLPCIVMEPTLSSARPGCRLWARRLAVGGSC